jgi:5-formyltetrahydrofolate cyclo-ligase
VSATDLLDATIATITTKILLNLPVYKNARRIGIYLSMPKGELCTTDIVYDSLREGKKVFVPYIYKSDACGVVKPRSVMNMVSLHSLRDYESLNADAWGIPSVSENTVNGRCQLLDAESDAVGTKSQQKSSINETGSRMESGETERLDVIVIPGVAFDKNLGRLGHGKGFYDYFLDRYHRSMAGPMPFLGTCIS